MGELAGGDSISFDKTKKAHNFAAFYYSSKF
jgi:hypothetical protein